MSRQSDIAALTELRDMITETRTMINMSNSELEKYEACEKELTGSKFVFQPLPTNQEETAKRDFFQAWKDKYSNPKPMQIRLQWIFTIVMAIYSVLVFVDMCTAKGLVFTNVSELQAFKEDPFGGLNWLIWIAQIVFSVTIAIVPWCVLKFEDLLLEDLLGLAVGNLILCGIAGFLFWAFCSGAEDGKVCGTYLLMAIGAVVLNWVFYGFCIVMSKIPILSAKQREVLAQERQKDIENSSLNIDKEKKDKEEWQAWWDVHKYELDEQMDIHMKMAKSALAKAEELQAKVDESDVVGEDEKDVAIIDWLLYILKGHRADSIKEALQQYDLMQHNQKMLEIEQEKYKLEAVRIQKEHEDRQKAMEMERYHQMQMQAQAARAADLQVEIAANTAATRDATDRMRREAAQHAADVAGAQQRVANEIAHQNRSDYYNN